ncbi:MAG: 16S rRNA (guanine(527)-N(7))-methyltransferase RsmG [Cyanomargarita calcarea GSE-NOS-MK-12-04C]|uniref:Ribosomal RNA small subunit methyltransferase G n=1 Tax=Cyanomargarita calcarea GSE-NOS-MK-12-04C TaxID=2839659 RepID=A0A951QSJ4_9CYAN|nr:16S rRNA (guanine(527)-N(7))-methyltransferase RsmG [Cyanomargarita calcarea GSE-NOS-MK-12-04C]
MADIWQQTLNWQPTIQEQEQFQRFYELILSGNQQLNLTRITEPQEFWEKHLWDSIAGIAPLFWGVASSSLSPHLPLPSSPTPQLIDIGTGAGFPGIPIAIAMNNCTVTLLDSTRKKVAFIEEILTALQLTNVKTMTARVEDLGHQFHHRQKYNVATIRAVGSANTCAEYTLPLLKEGGLAVIYRGNWTSEETTALENAVKQLGGVIESIEKFTTPLSESIRHCLYLRKVENTPSQFPRAVGVPTSKPL